MRIPEKITLVLFSRQGACIQSLSISANWILLLLGLIISGAVAIVAFCFLYGSFQEAKNLTAHMQNRISLQHEEILQQRQQITFFADEINRLKSSLLAFHQFEKKIRIISNLDENLKTDGIFGIGGSDPADIQTDISDEESHDELLREMHTQIHQITDAAITQQEGFTLLLNYLEDQRSLLSSTPSIWPTKGWISSGFGFRPSPFSGYREFHKGIDIAAPFGQEVVATGDGLVVFAGTKGTMGKMIIIDHGHGMISRYGHLDRISKNPGDQLKRGDTIGFIGTSGRTTGPHLHYEILVNSLPVKPQDYLLN